MLTRRPNLIATAIMVLVCAFAQDAASEPTSAIANSEIQPAINGDLREMVLHDLADRTLDTFDLFTAALILGGDRDRDAIVDCRKRLSALQTRLGNLATAEASQHEIAELTLRFLHREILTGEYQPGCCDLGATIQGGAHNCIMSTILFCVLGESLGLEIQPVALPDHVRCELINDGPGITIETTSSNGFAATDAGINAGDESIDSSRIGPTNDGAASARRISSVGLLAKVLYNRGLHSLDQRKFAAAFEQTELSHRLDPGHLPAAGNVASVINNWALHRCNDGDFAGAIELLDRGLLLTESKILDWNRTHIYSRWLQALEQSDSPDAAMKMENIKGAMEL